jgi:flavin reductase (DIM6/NTAB) family NADH-FMN oxidoreductase RutF
MTETPATHPNPEPEKRDRFLQAMSRAACTVNIVTTDGNAGRHGVTVSAMSSVSADGECPTLLVCVHHKSPAADAIRQNGVFCVNVLRHDQADVSDTFAGRIRRADGDKFGCAEWQAGRTGAPFARRGLVAFDCRVMSAQRVGTHYIFIGEVEDIYGADEGTPLIYANRTYGRPLPLAPLAPLANGCNA